MGQPAVTKTKVFTLGTDAHRRTTVSAVCSTCGSSEERVLARTEMPPGVVAKWFRNLGWDFNAKLSKATCPVCVADPPKPKQAAALFEVASPVAPADLPSANTPAPDSPVTERDVKPEIEPPPRRGPVRWYPARPVMGNVEPDVPTPSATLVTITPTMAMEFLEAGGRNRKVNWPHVEELAEDMKSGAWKLNGDTITRASSGRILDGQHRLHACIMANVSFDTFIANDVDEDTFDTKDIGRRRTASDVLSIDGVANGTKIAAALRFVRGILGGTVHHRGGGRMDIRAWLSAHPEIVHSARAMNRYRPYRSQGLAVALHYLLSQIDAPAASQFMAHVVDGAGLELDDPILLLRNRLIHGAPKNTMTHRGDPPVLIVSLTLRTWQAWREGRRYGKLLRAKRSPQDVIAQFLAEHGLGDLPQP